MKTFILRKNGVSSVRTDEASLPYQKLGIANNEIKTSIHKLLLSLNIGRFAISSSLTKASNSLILKIQTSEEKLRSFTKEKVTHIHHDVESVLRKVLVGYFSTQIGDVSIESVKVDENKKEGYAEVKISWLVKVSLVKRGRDRGDATLFEKQLKEDEKFLKKIRACRNNPEKMLQEFKKVYSEGSIVRNSRGEIDTEATIKKFENHLAEQMRINNRYEALANLTKEMEQIRKGVGSYARDDASFARMDIDRGALKQRIEERLQVCKDIVKYWGSRKGGFLATNDKDQIAADLEAIDKAEKFISRAQEVLQKLK